MDVVKSPSDHHRAVQSVGTCFLTIACAIFISLPTMAGAGNPEAGRQIYEESCEHCHGYAGDGQG